MSKFGGLRNFGWGKQLRYAGYNALKTAYLGKFGTVAAHSSRWGHFVQWGLLHGIKDARDISISTLTAYGAELRAQVAAGAMSVRYAQNLLSTANVVLSALRGDNSVRLSPADTVGDRSHVRTESPSAVDIEDLAPVINELQAAGHDRAATVLELARTFGLRLKEASLLSIREAIQQAQHQGAINVREGTKGGRGKEVDRWVPCGPTGLAILQRAIAIAAGGRNLIPSANSLKQFADHVHKVALPVLQRHGLGTVHDLRAAYACSRYRQLTGHPAPVETGKRTAAKTHDCSARDTISRELGHGRRDVAAAYVGSAR